MFRSIFFQTVHFLMPSEASVIGDIVLLIISFCILLFVVRVTLNVLIWSPLYALLVDRNELALLRVRLERRP